MSNDLLFLGRITKLRTKKGSGKMQMRLRYAPLLIGCGDDSPSQLEMGGGSALGYRMRQGHVPLLI